MRLLVRKISKSKWTSGDTVPEDIQADAITGCLRTHGNKLSVWAIQDESSIDEAFLALVAAGDRLDTIDVVQMNFEELQKDGFRCARTKGRTPVEDLVDTHLDICDLSYGKLGVIACYIANMVRNGKQVRRTVGELKEILRTAIAEGRLSEEELKEDIRKKL